MGKSYTRAWALGARTMEAATLTFHTALLMLDELPATELKMQTHTWEPLKSFLLLG